MTTIDPTALLGLCDEHESAYDLYVGAGVVAVPADTVRALVAAYVERDQMRAEVKRLRKPHRACEACGCDGCEYCTDEALVAERDDARAEAKALRAAVARMTGPEAVEAARTDLRGLPVIWHNDVLPRR
jgi:hypothetical protein